MQADKLRAIVAFLCGEAELDGRWYGDEENVPLVAGKYPARYWWRTQLRKEAEDLLAIAEAAEDLRAALAAKVAEWQAFADSDKRDESYRLAVYRCATQLELLMGSDALSAVEAP